MRTVSPWWIFPLALAAACTSQEEAVECDEVYAVTVAADSSDCVDEAGTLEPESYWYCLNIDGSQVNVYYALREGGDGDPETTDYDYFAKGTLQSGSYLTYGTGVVEDRQPDRSVLYSIIGEASLDEGSLVWHGTEVITVYPPTEGTEDATWPEGCTHSSTVASEAVSG